jgi:hypothetical protein
MCTNYGIAASDHTVDVTTRFLQKNVSENFDFHVSL